MIKLYSFWRIVLAFGWAKSLSWKVTTEKEKRVMLLSINIITRDDRKALEIIAGPAIMTIGFII